MFFYSRLKMRKKYLEESTEKNQIFSIFFRVRFLRFYKTWKQFFANVVGHNISIFADRRASADVKYLHPTYT